MFKEIHLFPYWKHKDYFSQVYWRGGGGREGVLWVHFLRRQKTRMTGLFLTKERWSKNTYYAALTMRALSGNIWSKNKEQNFYLRNIKYFVISFSKRSETM
jgi:hypothetical protein